MAVRSNARLYSGLMSREEPYRLASESMVIGLASQIEAGQVGAANGAEEKADFVGGCDGEMRWLPKTAQWARSPSPAPPPPFGTGRPRGEARWQWRVDATLFHAACQYRWWNQNKYGHIAGHFPGRGNVLLHHWVMEQFYGIAPHGELTTDHIDGNPSNNCLANLRPATKELQMLNKRTPSGFDVYRNKRFQARLRGKVLGTFATEAEARAAYLSAKSQAIQEEVRKSWELFSRQIKEARNG